MGEMELDAQPSPPLRSIGFRLKIMGKEDTVSERNSIY